jgi:hypothetical protein
MTATHGCSTSLQELLSNRVCRWVADSGMNVGERLLYSRNRPLVKSLLDTLLLWLILL